MPSPGTTSPPGSRSPSPGSTRSRAPSCADSATPACGAGSTCTRSTNTRPGRVRTTPGRSPRGPRPGREEDDMSEAINHADVRHTAAAHHEESFIRHYIFSTDHKMIGKQFLTLGLFGLMMGGILALLVRWELAWPESPVPGMGWVPEPTMYGGIIPPETYNSFFTMHATIMIFFAVMPILVGCFGNFLIPLMIGARDMAFPFLNMLSFWVGAVAAVIMFSSFFVAGGPAAAGWTSYAPLSADPVYTGVGMGQNLWCISLIVLGISSLMGSINYITTIINMRAPGMTWFRLPLVIWSLFITAILLLLALPVLTAALGMLLFDRM